MKRDLTDLLVCPVCKGDLALTVETEENGEIITGALRCVDSDIDYPIEDGIPNLLPREHATAT
jgi:uncharacterized protein YbaR (Trm112 family)